MSKPLLFSLLFLTSILSLQAQVGTDPNLLDPNGLPAVVPSKSGINYNSNSHRGSDMQKYRFPATTRQDEQSWMSVPAESEEVFQYTPVVPERDTSSVYVLDRNGLPVRNMNRVYSEPDPGNVIPLFSPDTTEALPYRSDVWGDND